MAVPGAPNKRSWKLLNFDSGEEIEGDFEAVGLTRNVSNNYTTKTALGRQHPVTQYLNGNLDTLSFEGRIRARDVFETQGFRASPANISSFVQGGPPILKPGERLDLLVSWTRVDPDLGRPPLVYFSLGEGDVGYGDSLSIITSIDNIVYDTLTNNGELRGCVFTVNLQQYEDDYEIGTFEPPETRYARAKNGEYYELLCQREYGNPLLAIEILNRHPEQPIPQPGDIVRLPSFDAIRSAKLATRSIALSGIRSSAESPQKDLRQHYTDRLNRQKKSLTVPKGL
jgi:hypothetical protein